MVYDFDHAVQRKNSAKWLEMDKRFGTNDLLPFHFADMDFIAPQPIIDALAERAQEGVYGYAYRPDSYFEAIQAWFFIHHNWRLERETLLFSPSVIAGMVMIIQELTQPGDNIVVQSPVYPPFYDAVRNTGRTLLLNPLVEENGRFVMDYDGLERLMRQNVKMLLLCSPHNPVGRVWTRAELERLGEICLAHGVRIFSDEVHADIVYQSHVHIPIASLSKELSKICITCIAPNKTFNLAGLQGATLVMEYEHERRLFDTSLGTLDIRRNNVFSLVAVEAAYRHGGEWYTQLLRYLNENRELVRQFFEDEPYGIRAFDMEGTYLQWLDLRKLGLTEAEIRDRILLKGKIAMDTGGRYLTDGFLRMSIGCPRDMLREGLQRLDVALRNL